MQQTQQCLVGSVLAGLFGVVRTTWLVPGNPFVLLGLNSNYDIHSAIPDSGIDPSHTVHLQGPPRAIYTFVPLGLARTLLVG